MISNHLTAECLPLFSANGSFRKTHKSKLLEKLTHQLVYVPSCIALIDMGMIWRFASPTAEDREKGDGTRYTWGDYSQKVVSIILARHVNATKIICVNDPYDHAQSIKDKEHDLHVQGEGHIPNVFMKSSHLFPSPHEFKTLLCCPGNKKHLQNLIKGRLSQIAMSVNRRNSIW